MCERSLYFQCVMDALMDNVEPVGVSKNDVVGHPNTIEEHGNRLQNVFNVTAGLSLKLEISKGEISKSSVELLASNLGAEEMEVDPRNLEANQDAPIPH